MSTRSGSARDLVIVIVAVAMVTAVVPVGSLASEPGDDEGQAPPPGAWVTAADEDQPLSVTVDGRAVTLSLEHDRDLLTDASAAEGLRPLQGSIVGAEDSIVRVVIGPDGARGLVWSPELGTVGVLTDEAGQVHLIPGGQQAGPSVPFEPAVAPADGPLEQERTHPFNCLALVPHGVANPAGLALGWPTRSLELAIAVDAAFVDRYGSAWDQMAVSFLNTMDEVYERDVDLSIKVVDLHIHHGDLLASDTGAALSAVEDHYESAHTTLDREAVHLFSGVDYDGAAGQANCVGSAGNPDDAYSVSEADSCEPIEFLAFQFFKTICEETAIHEVGHLLGAHHHYHNCAESVRALDPADPFGACTVMVNDISLATLSFSAANRLVMRGWADAEDL